MIYYNSDHMIFVVISKMNVGDNCIYFICCSDDVTYSYTFWQFIIVRKYILTAIIKNNHVPYKKIIINIQ